LRRIVPAQCHFAYVLRDGNFTQFKFELLGLPRNLTDRRLYMGVDTPSPPGGYQFNGQAVWQLQGKTVLTFPIRVATLSAGVKLGFGFAPAFGGNPGTDSISYFNGGVTTGLINIFPIRAFCDLDSGFIEGRANSSASLQILMACISQSPLI
jgi:hypothetical protein